MFSKLLVCALLPQVFSLLDTWQSAKCAKENDRNPVYFTQQFYKDTSIGLSQKQQKHLNLEQIPLRQKRDMISAFAFPHVALSSTESCLLLSHLSLFPLLMSTCSSAADCVITLPPFCPVRHTRLDWSNFTDCQNTVRLTPKLCQPIMEVNITASSAAATLSC